MTKRRNDEANLFKALMNQMHGRTEEAETPAIGPEGVPVIDVEATTVTEPKLLPAAPIKKTKKKAIPLKDAKKRGRPATGKRSDRHWYGRTFYVRKNTDIIVEDALYQLKRRGVDLDKSDMADALLMAWGAVYLGEQDDFLISDILKYLPDRDVEDPESQDPESQDPEQLQLDAKQPQN